MSRSTNRKRKAPSLLGIVLFIAFVAITGRIFAYNGYFDNPFDNISFTAAQLNDGGLILGTDSGDSSSADAPNGSLELSASSLDSTGNGSLELSASSLDSSGAGTFELSASDLSTSADANAAVSPNDNSSTSLQLPPGLSNNGGED